MQENEADRAAWDRVQEGSRIALLADPDRDRMVDWLTGSGCGSERTGSRPLDG